MNCPLCGGEGNLLGCLGTRAHFRCRACGADFSETVEARTGVDCDDILDRLVDTGILTIDQVTRVAEYLRDEENARYDAEHAAQTSKP